MDDKKFNPEKLQKLNNPSRLKQIPPDYIWSKLELEDPEVLVDIGAGTGLFSIEFSRFMDNVEIYACDISDVMIDWMETNISIEYPGIIPVKMAENYVPLDDAIADLVFMINLHHELEDPHAVLKEGLRLLKPGGKIFIADWRKSDTGPGPRMEIRYLPETVRDQIESAGFHSIKIYDDLQNHFLVTAVR